MIYETPQILGMSLAEHRTTPLFEINILTLRYETVHQNNKLIKRPVNMQIYGLLPVPC